jgi:hypothetical protein
MSTDVAEPQADATRPRLEASRSPFTAPWFSW